jgi:hypothetical protein
MMFLDARRRCLVLNEHEAAVEEGEKGGVMG